CGDIPRRRSPPGNPSTALTMGREPFWFPLQLPPMFNFSANHLLLLSRTEYRSCVVFLMRDDSTRRVYRLYDFPRAIQITPDQYYCGTKRSRPGPPSASRGTT